MSAVGDLGSDVEAAAAGLAIEWLPDRVAPLRLNLTLSLPERHNAQTRALWAALRAVRRRVPGSVRAVVLRGAGPSFSSGIELSLLRQLVAEGVTDEVIAFVQEAFDWSSDNAFVSVAALHGHALGAGLQLALCTDLRVVTADAVLGLPEASYGIVPDLGGTWPLVRSVGYATALDLTVTGRRLSGREAHALGLAQRLAEPGGLDEAVETLVGELLARDRDVVGEVKALLRGAETRTHEQQRTAEREAQLRVLDGLRERARGGDMPQASAERLSAPLGPLVFPQSKPVESGSAVEGRTSAAPARPSRSRRRRAQHRRQRHGARRGQRQPVPHQRHLRGQLRRRVVPRVHRVAHQRVRACEQLDPAAHRLLGVRAPERADRGRFVDGRRGRRRHPDLQPGRGDEPAGRDAADHHAGHQRRDLLAPAHRLRRRGHGQDHYQGPRAGRPAVGRRHGQRRWLRPVLLHRAGRRHLHRGDVRHRRCHLEHRRRPHRRHQPGHGGQLHHIAGFEHRGLGHHGACWRRVRHRHQRTGVHLRPRRLHRWQRAAGQEGRQDRAQGSTGTGRQWVSADRCSAQAWSLRTPPTASVRSAATDTPPSRPSSLAGRHRRWRRCT